MGFVVSGKMEQGMKPDSELFDGIRVKPKKCASTKNTPQCEWPGCTTKSEHRSPKGRGREGEYWHFCLTHAHAYNKSYNYFAGMDDEAIKTFQEKAERGHRITHSIGINYQDIINNKVFSENRSHQNKASDSRFDRVHHYVKYCIDKEISGNQASLPPNHRRRVRGRAECRSLDTMGLSDNPCPADIRAQFKVLVKRHHPDVNGGDRSHEEYLQKVIEAYNYLKSIGVC